MSEFKPHDLNSIKTRVRGDGYVIASCPGHPNGWMNNGRRTAEITLHRLVVENELGRYLETHEVVHHLDENRQNNHPDNLELTDESGHWATHHPPREPPLLVCGYCGDEFRPPPQKREPQKYSKRKYCSAVCRDTARLQKQTDAAVAFEEDFALRYAKPTGSCLICGSKTKKSRRKFCSVECSRKAKRKTSRPPAGELAQLVWERPTSHIAKQFGVSDSAVAKWCRQYGIDKPPRGYWTGRSVDTS